MNNLRSGQIILKIFDERGEVIYHMNGPGTQRRNIDGNFVVTLGPKTRVRFINTIGESIQTSNNTFNESIEGPFQLINGRPFIQTTITPLPFINEGFNNNSTWWIIIIIIILIAIFFFYYKNNNLV